MSSVVDAAATALAAAALLGSAAAAQRHATLTVPTYDAGDPRLVTALTRAGHPDPDFPGLAQPADYLESAW